MLSMSKEVPWCFQWIQDSTLMLSMSKEVPWFLVNEFLAGAGTDAPDVEDEHVTSRPSVAYDDMWTKTLLETYKAEEDDAGSYGASSPESTGSIESSISSHFGGMNYPSLFSSRPSGYGAS